MPSLTLNGTVAGENAAIGTLTWLNETSALTSNDAHATSFFSGVDQVTHYLLVRGFDFSSIPASAIIDGFEWRVEAHFDAFNQGDVVDWSVRMKQSGPAPVGDDKAAQSSLSFGSDGIVTYGGPSDLWGLSWTVDDLSDRVGLLYSVKCIDFPDSQQVKVDHIELTIYYTIPPKEYPFYRFKQ